MELGGLTVKAAEDKLQQYMDEVCGGSLWAKFVQNSKVQVEENVIVQDSLMNCEVSAQHRIILQGKRAQITGGHLFATETVLAKNIGSAGGGTETVI